MKNRLDEEVGDRLHLEFGVEGSSERWRLHVKPRAVSLAAGASESLTFDREGRPYAAFVEGRNYRRGLDGRVLEKYREGEGEGERQRRFLDATAAADFRERVYGRVAQLAGGKVRFAAEPSRSERELFWSWAGRLRRWDAAALERDRQRFHAIYRTVSILPPDQYMALVVQTTEGCPWNRCAFCDLYRDRPYRVKSPRQLQEHLEAIRDFLGEGIRLRRSVFLGDANMLAVPWQRLLETFAQVRQALAGREGPEGGFYGFTDLFGGRLRDVEALGTLRERGLRRLYVGLETGSDRLLQLLNKPGTAAEAVRAVDRMHRAGIGVGVIVLLGLGGHARADEHETETVRALNAMRLGRGDVVYFSPLIEHAHGEYARLARQERFGRMTLPAARSQRRRMEAGLRFGAGKPLTSIYDIRDFVY